MIAARTATGTASNENQSQISLPPSRRLRSHCLGDLSTLPDLSAVAAPGSVLTTVPPLLIVRSIQSNVAKRELAKQKVDDPDPVMPVSTRCVKSVPERPVNCGQWRLPAKPPPIADLGTPRSCPRDMNFQPVERSLHKMPPSLLRRCWLRSCRVVGDMSVRWLDVLVQACVSPRRVECRWLLAVMRR